MGDRERGCPKIVELKVTHKTHNIQPQHGRQNARQRQLQQLERQRQTCSGASRSASSKHGRSRPERPRLGASVDGEARQKTALHTVRPRRSTRRRCLVPSRDVVVVPQLIGVAGDGVSAQLDFVHRSTAHSTRLEALHGRPCRAHFRTSSPFEVNSRTDCTVDDNNWLEIRAHTRIISN